MQPRESDYPFHFGFQKQYPYPYPPKYLWEDGTLHDHPQPRSNVLNAACGYYINFFTEVTRQKDGTIIFPDGTIYYPDGEYPDGTIRYKDGTIHYPDGTTHTLDGIIYYPDGTRRYPNGIIVGCQDISGKEWWLATGDAVTDSIPGIGDFKAGWRFASSDKGFGDYITLASDFLVPSWISWILTLAAWQSRVLPSCY